MCVQWMSRPLLRKSVPEVHTKWNLNKIHIMIKTRDAAAASSVQVMSRIASKSPILARKAWISLHDEIVTESADQTKSPGCKAGAKFA